MMRTQNKYVERINRLKGRVLGTYPEIDMENAVILTRGFQESEGEPLVIQKAHAFRKQCMEKTVKIWDDELIVGNAGSKQRGGLVCPDDCWTFLDRELDTINERKYDPFHLKDEDKKAFLEIVKPYWTGRSIYEKWCRQIPEETRVLRDCGVLYIDRKAVRGWGELTPDYDLIINEGVEGLEKRISDAEAKLDITVPGDYEKMVYLRALSHCADGLRRLGKRYAEEARRLASAEQDPTRKRELLDIAAVCDRVPAKPARTFWEALQSMYFYHICVFMEHNAASYNPGRMDQYLYPYYKADLEAGHITPDKAQELLDCAWVKFSEQCLLQDATTARYSAGYPMFQNLCAGGVDKNGMDAVNDLSYMILQATMDVQMYQPSLSVRYNLARNPDRFLRKIVELIQLGTGFPAFHSDEAGTIMMLNKGVPLPEAYNWNPCGCVETSLAGKMRCYTSYADYNLGAIVEFALNDGKSRKYDRYAGARTGDPRSFETYEQFLEAIKTQIRYVLRAMIAGNQVKIDIVRDMVCPNVSLSFKECIKRAKDYAWGGAKYNIGDGLDAIGVADLINSIMAVKELVYEKNLVSMERLISALAVDFQGYDDVLNLCLGCPKYGNDDDEVNTLVRDLFNYIADYIESFSNKFGHYTAGILPVSGNTPFGMEVGTLPSGRRAGMPLADGISPNVGTDTEGMSAIVRSCANIPHGRYDQGTLLNLKMDPAFARGERAVESMMAFLKTLCSMGVYHVQFNVVDEKELRDAQEHPEAHTGLLIRVAGYTAYFTELSRETQNDIISRTTQIAI
jgi:formate C-acetyltransferase